MTHPRRSKFFAVSLIGFAAAALLGTYIQAVRLSQLHHRLALLEADNTALLRRMKLATASSDTSHQPEKAPKIEDGGTTAAAISHSLVEVALKLLYARSLPPEALKADIEFAYARFLRKAKLTAEQLNRFEHSIADHQWKQMEIESVARSEHLPPGDPIIIQLTEEERARFADNLRTILGTDEFEAFERTQSRLPMQAVADEVAAETMSSPTPFTSPQAEELIKILSAAAKPATAGHGRAFDWDQVMANAGRVLLPNQRAALQTVRARWLAEQFVDSTGW